jgi:DNA-binding NarL/FixJ family response regulator
MKIKVLLADDHTVLRETLQTFIEKETDIQILDGACDGWEAVKKAKLLKPDIVIMDVSMPNLYGIEATSEIKKDSPEIKIIALTQYCDKRYIKRMMEAGSSSFLSKNCSGKELVQAIREVYTEGNFISEDKEIRRIINEILKEKIKNPNELTPREIEVLKLIAKGKSIKEIAPEFFVGVKAIEVERVKIMKKLNIFTIPELVIYAIKEGYIFL